MASYKGGLGSRRRLRYGLKIDGDPARKEPSKVVKYNLNDQIQAGIVDKPDMGGYFSHSSLKKK